MGPVSFRSCWRATTQKLEAASLLIYNNVTNLGRLWDRHKEAFTKDFLHQARQVNAQKASTKEVYITSLPFVRL